MTVTRIVTLGGPIHATVGTFETRRKHEEPKVTTGQGWQLEASKTTTVRRIASSGPHPCTVGTVERFGLGSGRTIPRGRGVGSQEHIWGL